MQKEVNNNNIIALTDSIHYYKTKNNELVASKVLLEGDLSTLQLANDSLYNALKEMNVKDPSSVVYITSVIDNPQNDTIWTTDTIISNFNINKTFAFNNKYRSLEGNIFANDTTIGLNISKDQTYVLYINSEYVVREGNSKDGYRYEHFSAEDETIPIIIGEGGYDAEGDYTISKEQALIINVTPGQYYFIRPTINIENPYFAIKIWNDSFLIKK